MSGFFVREDNTETVKKEALEAILRGLEKCGLQAQNYANALAPHDTGRLRNSITHIVSGNAGFNHAYSDDQGNSFADSVGGAGDAEDCVVYVGTNVEYAEYVEFGTIKAKAQPYLKPAFTRHAKEYNDILKEELQGK